MKHIILSVLLAGFATTVNAQVSDWNNFNAKKHSVSVNMGLIQPFLLKGANVEVDYRYGHFVASYSHGWSLDMKGNTVKDEMQRQNISAHLPFSTGFGVGASYAVNKANLIFDARFEPKLHRYDIAYGSDLPHTQSTHIASYNTITLGGGLYVTYVPFAKSESLARGINISMSFRYWQNVHSTLKGNEISYFNTFTNQQERHESAKIGIANTPFIFNISVGYIFKRN